VAARWHVAALLIFVASAAAVMRGWLMTDLLPVGDFGGYAAVIDNVRDSVLRYGRMPNWNPKWFAGSTYFMSSLKEYASLPVAMWLEPVAATKVMFAALRIASALLMYGLFAHYFRAPIAGIMAGWPYAFGACANHLTRHLDVAFSSVLFPLVLFATVEAVRQRSALRWATVGALVGCQFCINYNQAMMASLLVGLAAAAEIGSTLDPSATRFTAWRTALVSRRMAAHVAIAGVVFFFFAGSQIAWFATDLQHHALPSAAQNFGFRRVLSTYSPVALINRLGWLNQWLPPKPATMATDALGSQARYLGIIAIAITLAGALLGRHDRRRTAWAGAAAVLFFAQYFLSVGPYSTLDQILRGAHLPQSTAAGVSTAVLIAGAGCLLLGLRRASTAAAIDSASTTTTRAAAWPLLGLGTLLLASRVSVFDLALRLVPPLDSIRSPGHFFDIAPFSFYLLFGLSIVAINRRLDSEAARRALWLAVGTLLILDFWPSTQLYFRGTPAAPIRDFSEVTRGLPDDLSVRMLYPAVSTADSRDIRFIEQASILASRAPVGAITNWLPWQAGKHWSGFTQRALESITSSDGIPSDALRSIGRIRYAILPAGSKPPGHHWRRGPANQVFALWIADDISPMAYASRSIVLILGDTGKPEGFRHRRMAMGMARQAFAAIEAGWERNLPLLTVSASYLTPPLELLDRVRLVAVEAALPTRLPAVAGRPIAIESLPARRPRARQRWQDLVASLPDDEPIAARYSRPGPERIEIDVDAGGAPAMVFVSEAYHPWWSARVDGIPAKVYRAQHAFMAVALAAGPHRVELNLQPPAIVGAADVSTALAWITALLIGGFLTLRRFLRRATGGAGSYFR